MTPSSPKVLRSLLDRLNRPIPIDRHRLLAGLGFTFIVLFLFRDEVFRSRILYQRDISTLFYAQAENFVRCVRSGSWPLWDPYRGFGQPLLAGPETEVFYPFTWLNLLLKPWTFYAVFVLFHLVLSGVGLYSLARKWGLSHFGAFVAGGVWVASGPFLSLSLVWHHFASAAWLPWVVLTSQEALESGRVTAVVRAGLVAALQILAGSADVVCLTLISTTVYALASLGSTRLVALLRRGTAVWCFAIGLTACQWLPAADLVRNSARSELPIRARTTWSLNPLQLPEMLLRARWSELPLPPTDDPRELGAPFVVSLYFGPAVLALVLGSFAVPGRSRRGLSLILGALALGIALGRHFFFYKMAVFLLPPLRILRFPVKAMVLVGFSSSILAGMGFEGWKSSAVRDRPRVAVRIGLLCLSLGLLLAALMGSSLQDTSEGSNGAFSIRTVLSHAWWNVMLSGVVCLLAALLVGFRGPSRAFALACLALLDLVTAQGVVTQGAPLALATHRPEVLSLLDTSEYGRVYVDDYSVATSRRYELAGGRAPVWPYWPVRLPSGWSRVQALFLGAQMYLNPPIGERWGIFGSYDQDLTGLVSRPVTAFVEHVRDSVDKPTFVRYLRMGAVKSVVAILPPPSWNGLVAIGKIPGLLSNPIQVLQVPAPLGRSYVVGGAQVVDDTRALEILDDPNFDLESRVLLSAGSDQIGPPGFRGESHIVRFEADRVLLDASLTSPGYVVLVDAYDPGWAATVDGKEVSVERANLGFRAVRVPEGRHVLEYRYRPRAVSWGLLLTGIAFLVGLFTVVFSGRDRA